MKKLNITKKQYAESKYFNKKYGALKFVSESGKLYKTDKGVVLALEGTDEVHPENAETTKESIEDIMAAKEDEVGGTDKGDEETIKKEEVVAALTDVVEVIKGIAADNEIEVPGLAEDEDDEDKGDEDDDDDDEEVVDESLSDIGNAIKKTAGEVKDGIKNKVNKVKKAIGDAIKGPFRKGDHVEISNEKGDTAVATVTAGTLGGTEYTVLLQRVTDECTEEPVKKECGCKECKCESTKAKKSRIIREAIAKKVRARKMMEARKARLAKIAESRKTK